jgi:oxalate decarboxylase/phosphoglucose isomerase-like protein (cupin superfamily)
MDIKNLNEVPAFITKDSSEIRELLAHRNSAIRNQSLAEACLPIGTGTQEHFNRQAEEIYYITHGAGGQKHKLWNTGNETLRLLCCCAPAYEHSDTILTES